jgi:sugar phosphate isomerase/epimerase
MTIHPDEVSAKVWGTSRAIDRNIRMIKVIAREASKYEIKILIENSSRLFNEVEHLDKLFTEVDDIGFTLDVGHANLNTKYNKTEMFLDSFIDRLDHVHLSDNMGGNSDLHLPLGAGGVPWERIFESLKEAGYDGKFTLEVFSRDYRYILVSREKLYELWSG